MIIKLNTDGTITIDPIKIPEPLHNVYITYVFPKGLNHLRPVLYWGTQQFEGDNIHIDKDMVNFKMKVVLFDKNNDRIKEYKLNQEPDLYVGYNIKQIDPDILKYIEQLEKENKTLKEKGDLL